MVSVEAILLERNLLANGLFLVQIAILIIQFVNREMAQSSLPPLSSSSSLSASTPVGISRTTGECRYTFSIYHKCIMADAVHNQKIQSME